MALVLLSGLGYGGVPILARVAYESGSNAPTSLLGRFGLAAVLFWVALGLSGRVRRLPGPIVARLALMGVLFSSGSVMSFMAIERIPASVVALVFYTYPAFVTLGAALLFGTRVTPARLIVLVLALGGCALTVDLDAGPVDALGLALALATAGTYAGYVLLGSRVTRSLPPMLASVWIISTATVLMGLIGATGAFGDRLTLDVAARGWLAILALALGSTVVAIAAFLAGLMRLDPFRATILSTVEPVVSVLLAVLLLGERLTPQQALGGAVIIAAALLLQLVGRVEARMAPARR